MANEVTYAQIRHLLPDIWEAVLFYIEFNFFMAGTVNVFTDQTGFQPRNVSAYREGSIQDNLGELEDLSPALLDRELLARLIPAEHGKQYLVTDRRVETDDASIIADSASAIGYELGKYMEQALLGDFASLTGGLIDKTNASLTWADIYNGRARLAAAGVPGGYNVVLHEYQWLDLASAANIAAVGTSTSSQPTLRVRDDIQSQYYVASLGDMNFYVTGLIAIDGNADAIGAIYNRMALALDLRRGIRIEAERDASLRATELNGTVVFAHGTWRADWGVQIKSDATEPGSDVTLTPTVVLFGTVDDATVSTGTDVTFTFTLVNTGTVVVTDIVVTFTVDSDFTYVSTTQISAGAFDATAKEWDGFQLAPGQAATLVVKYDAAGSGDMVGSVAGSPSVGSVTSTVSITVS